MKIYRLFLHVVLLSFSEAYSFYDITQQEYDVVYDLQAVSALRLFFIPSNFVPVAKYEVSGLQTVGAVVSMISGNMFSFAKAIERDGGIAAYLTYLIYGSKSYITTLALNPELIEAGDLELLLRYAVGDTYRRGAASVMVKIKTTQTSLLAQAETTGFVVIHQDASWTFVKLVF